MTQKPDGCFAAAVASILERPLDDLDGLHEDNAADYGLRYDEWPATGDNVPVGWHIIAGVSPRGGQHAIVGKNGHPRFDPHPQDGTGRGLVKIERYGVIGPVGRAADVRHYDKTCEKCGVPIANIAKVNTCQACRLELSYERRGLPVPPAERRQAERVREALRRRGKAEDERDDLIRERRKLVNKLGILPRYDEASKELIRRRIAELEARIAKTPKARDRLHRALDAVMDAKATHKNAFAKKPAETRAEVLRKDIAWTKRALAKEKNEETKRLMRESIAKNERELSGLRGA